MSYIIEDLFTSNGYQCIVVLFLSEDREPKWRCGYVLIDKYHPLYGLDYRGSHDLLSPYTIKEVFDVHGWITFSGEHSLFPLKDKWAFGFYCTYLGDTLDKQALDYVRLECESLAKQLKRIEQKGKDNVNT